LELHGVSSIDDLGKNLKEYSGFSKLLGDKKLEDILHKATTLEKYEEYWKTQETQKKTEADDNLDDDDKRDKQIADLKDEIKSIKDGKQKEISDAKAKREAQEAIDGYTREVTSFIDKNEIPKEYASFTKQFFGLDNPFNEVDITDTVDVRKMLKNGHPRIQEFEQAVIKRYLDGKIKIPEMSESKPADPMNDKPKPKNLKEARNVAKELLTKAFGRPG